LGFSGGFFPGPPGGLGRGGGGPKVFFVWEGFLPRAGPPARGGKEFRFGLFYSLPGGPPGLGPPKKKKIPNSPRGPFWGGPPLKGGGFFSGQGKKKTPKKKGPLGGGGNWVPKFLKIFQTPAKKGPFLLGGFGGKGGGIFFLGLRGGKPGGRGPKPFLFVFLPIWGGGGHLKYKKNLKGGKVGRRVFPPYFGGRGFFFGDGWVLKGGGAFAGVLPVKKNPEGFFLGKNFEGRLGVVF